MIFGDRELRGAPWKQALDDVFIVETHKVTRRAVLHLLVEGRLHLDEGRLNTRVVIIREFKTHLTLGRTVLLLFCLLDG